MKMVLKYCKPYIPHIILIILFLFGQVMCELALPGVYGKHNRLRNSEGRHGVYLDDGHNHAGDIGRNDDIRHGRKLSGCQNGSPSPSRDIRRALFCKVTNFSAAELESFSTASLITRSTNDITDCTADNGDAASSGDFCPDNGYRCVGESAEYERGSFMDSGTGTAGDNHHHGNGISHGAA